MADAFDSPIDIDVETPAKALSGLAQMAAAVGVATLLLLLFNAHALAAWADGLAPGTRTEAISRAAQALLARTQARGLDAPRAVLNGRWEEAKALKWTGRWPGQPQDQRKKS
jgi:hypothetical protein